MSQEQSRYEIGLKTDNKDLRAVIDEFKSECERAFEEINALTAENKQLRAEVIYHRHRQDKRDPGEKPKGWEL